MHLSVTNWCPLLLLFGLPCFLSGHDSQNDRFPTKPMAQPELAESNGTLYASCKMKPNSRLAADQPKVYGRVLFRQGGVDRPLEVMFKLKGFPIDIQKRAIHIHQFGDLSKGCDSTGGHYNPHKVNHPGHPGDFGNFVPRGGRIHERTTSEATLFGPLSVLGRSVVLHAGEDDLGQGGDGGSLLHGNAGYRLACCIIGITSTNL
ncbi:extracellular superoxide dismutase [Cu-Zn]-like [Brienomyrus brachyistius]|uniref:extracellular superoxide dismutase [Cu-Zn]-like n=1 Tax=Brienomyrus brachyistius TaxID=42636 RepID=UPI0020B23E26|nr:extracellular superoxide dismutase [Cu-Zn]-like [Brienomyrus brachyistius]XP_048852123.1 extracellular superoxide dismutase [Cu-Zn]-like [Brienomyrus brachyistius]